jgi:hypothetical protein
MEGEPNAAPQLTSMAKKATIIVVLICFICPPFSGLFPTGNKKTKPGKSPHPIFGLLNLSLLYHKCVLIINVFKNRAPHGGFVKNYF